MNENMENALMLACLYTLKDRVTRFIKSHKNGFSISLDESDHLIKIFYHDKFVHTESISGEKTKLGQQAIFQYHLDTPMKPKLSDY